MVNFCAAFGCSNSGSKESCRTRGISFHSFPLKNKKLLDMWVLKLRRKNFQPTRSSRLCSEHFEEEHFTYQSFTNHRLLKKTAVPTKFCFVKEKPEMRQRTSYNVKEAIMPIICAAYGCTNRSTKESKEKDISFHHFPFNDKIRLKQWLIKIRRKNFKPSANSRLCSEHFMDEDFEYQPFTNRRGLKKTAIPSKFCFTEAERQARAISELESDSMEEDAYEANSSSNHEVATQTEENVISCLLDENNRLQAQIMDMKKDMMKSELNPDSLDEKYMTIFVGFSRERFEAIHSFLKDIEKQKLFIFLMKLKSGMSESMMGFFFKTSQSTISRSFNAVTDLIYNKIHTVGIWPDKSKILESMPAVFRENFPQCRVIVDCLEFQIQKPSNAKEQKWTFNSTKNTNTIKCLIGIAPSGNISFISEACGGGVSDKELFLTCGILDALEPGDIVVAEKGFTVLSEVEDKGCKLLTPEFMKDKIQFHIIEKKDEEEITRHRVHVDRSILRIRHFKFFNGQICYNSLHSINKLIHIIAFFTNFGNPLVKF